PPVSGGSSRDEDRISRPEDFISTTEDFILTTEPLSLELLKRDEQIPECGATVILDGFARGITKSKRTSYLIYEAYDSMAILKMHEIGRIAMNRFSVSRIKIFHRLGKIEIGETSVLVAVTSPHRKAAFEACQWAIRELKRTVPIWKKEFYEDGSAWVQGEATWAQSD
ncbi:MAG: molybdenum cofactor biosynthesis protein MoaE, partial [Pyrinomonadaceae bacterium]